MRWSTDYHCPCNIPVDFEWSIWYMYPYELRSPRAVELHWLTLHSGRELGGSHLSPKLKETKHVTIIHVKSERFCSTTQHITVCVYLNLCIHALPSHLPIITQTTIMYIINRNTSQCRSQCKCSRSSC